jgi:DNA-binding NtrC family response regulator
MCTYEWTGNIREMENVLERAILLCKGKVLQDLFLPDIKQQKLRPETSPFALQSHQEQERAYILFVLEACHWKIHGATGAAAILQLPPTTLQSKMLKLGIKKQFSIEEQGK